MFKRFFHGMLAEGIYLPPSPFEAAFISVTHGGRELQRTLKAAEKVAAGIAKHK
jgi:glutamate-1-semialdehyde 2,1-aminomutase